MGVVGKKYTLSGAPTAETVERIDEMLEDIYSRVSDSIIHDLLSASHGDVVPDDVERGALITGQIPTGELDPKWKLLSLGATARVLRSNGSDALWAQVVLTTDVTGVLPVANGGTGTSTQFTTGSVVFAGASGVYSQDNANLFWDDSANRMGIGANSGLSGRLHVFGAAGDVHTIFARTGAAGNNVLRGANSAGVGIFNLVDNSGAALLRLFDSSGTLKVDINSNGESFFRGGVVGVDTAGLPTAAFQVGDTNAAPAGAYTAIAGTKTASAGIAVALSLRTNLTAAANNDILTQFNNDSATYAKGALTGLKVAVLRFAGSNISVSGTGTIDEASTLWIPNAPSVGTNNYAVLVDEGTSLLGGGIQLKGASVTTGLTSIAPTNVAHFLRVTDPTDGGITIDSMSSATTVPLLMRGIFGSTDPTDTTPAIAIRAGRRSGTGGTNLADAETAVQFQKFDGTQLVTIRGDGGVGIGTATPATLLSVAGVITAASGTATPAGGSSAARLLFGTTAGFGVYYGSGAPTVSAAQGSLYLRSDGLSTSTRLYVNTDGATTWTNFTSAA